MIAGRYELGREIGRGGAGIVWLAQDTLLHRPVAMKQIGRAPGATDVDVERAAREARLSASIHHPHVVSVFDRVVDEATGEQWLVMEYVDGASLSQLVRERGPMPPEPAARIMAQVADALAAAHTAGITHRDVKPSNILVQPDGTAKLTDFGIARGVADAQLTQTGLLSGSPAYLAPEVASGQRADMSADVWSWGASLFHVLSGRPPYNVGDNVIGALYRIVHEEPPRLATAGPLAPVLEGTMTKDPSQRWPMTRVCDELAALDRQGTVAQTAVMPAVPPSAGDTAVLPPETAVLPADTDVLAETGLLPTAGAAAGTAQPWWRRPVAIAVAGVLAVVLLVVVLTTLLDGSGGDAIPTRTARSSRSTSSPSSTPTPTAAGMRAFIRDYVRTVADDPEQAWTMLTRRFQVESGGFARYRAFWEPATDGTVSDIQADPTTLRVSYRPHFDDWHNSDNPTVLDLVFRNGRYLIDAEHTIGFTPAPAPNPQPKPAPNPAPKHKEPHPKHKGKAKGHGH